MGARSRTRGRFRQGTAARPSKNRLAVDDRAKEIQRRLELPMLIFALLTIPAIIIEETHNLPLWLDDLGIVLNWVIWLAFLGEAIIMIKVSPHPWQWIRHHPLEVAIILLTPPFLPAELQATRVFRLIRLLRLFEAGFILRRMLSTEGIRDAAVLAVLTVIGGGAAFAAVERTEHTPHLSTWDGVWWAMTTVTTVGYGDIVPMTSTGRIIAIAVMLVGIGFIAILTAGAAERFIRSQGDIRREQQAIEREQQELERETRDIEREQRSIDELLSEIVQRLDRIERAGGDKPPG